MSAATYVIRIEQGATYYKKFAWQNADTTPIDLTNFTAVLQIRPSVAATTLIHELTTANSEIVLGGAEGTIELTVSASATRVFTFKTATYALELTSPGGITTRLLQGTVTLSPSTVH